MDDDCMRSELELVNQLSGFIGATVKRAQLKVWPTPDWPEADVRLNVELLLANGSITDLTFMTGSNGTTPEIIQERIPESIPFSELQERATIWRTDEFWDRPENTEYEVFDLDLSDHMSWIRNSVLRSAEIVCYLSDFAATAIGLVFDRGTIWSVAGPVGNAICNESPKCYLDFPSIRILVDESALADP